MPRAGEEPEPFPFVSLDVLHEGNAEWQWLDMQDEGSWRNGYMRLQVLLRRSDETLWGATVRYHLNDAAGAINADMPDRQRIQLRPVTQELATRYRLWPLP